MADGDKGYIQEISGTHLLPFTYLGAKHVVTGYDHLLFLAGVIFFLYKLKYIALYLSLFAIGHTVTILYGVYAGVNVNAYLIEAIIGLSVVYKALVNLGPYPRWFGVQPNTKVATLVFGLFHGFGLAAKISMALGHPGVSDGAGMMPRVGFGCTPADFATSKRPSATQDRNPAKIGQRGHNGRPPARICVGFDALARGAPSRPK